LLRCTSPVLALLGPRELSALSPQSRPKRTDQVARRFRFSLPAVSAPLDANMMEGFDFGQAAGQPVDPPRCAGVPPSSLPRERTRWRRACGQHPAATVRGRSTAAEAQRDRALLTRFHSSAGWEILNKTTHRTMAALAIRMTLCKLTISPPRVAASLSEGSNARRTTARPF
jgi:hypothetical protein